MDVTKNLVGRTWRHFMHDSLYRNSIFLMSSTAVVALTTFAFLSISARLYSTNAVGIATATISATSLLANLSILGLNNAVIRFYHSIETFDRYINTVLVVIMLASITASTIFLLGSPWFSPKLSLYAHNPLLLLGFITLTCLTTVNLFTDSVFIAKRIAIYIFIENIFMGLAKAIFPLAFVRWHEYGILLAFSLGILAALAVTVVCFGRLKYQFKSPINFALLQGTRAYAFGNYISGIASSSLPLVIPLIVINRLGAKNSAYFYIALTIANLLYIIPSSINRSLFAEGSYNEISMKHHAVKSMKLTFSLLVVANIGILLLGKTVLYIFGKNYAAASFDLLVLLALSSFFVAIISIVGTILNIQRKTLPMTIMNVICFLLVVVMTLVTVHNGILAVGKGWLFGQMLGSMTALGFYAVFIHKPKLEAVK